MRIYMTKQVPYYRHYIMTSNLIELTHEFRKDLWDNGYRPIPILNPDSDYPNAGKRPAGSGPDWGGWEHDARRDPPYAVVATPRDIAMNTGILGDGLRAVDIDVDDPQIAASIDRLCVEILGDAPVRFRDDSPRRMRVFRAAEGQPPKDSVAEDRATASAAGRKPWKVEVLGHGNQFVAFGIHTEGAFLDWEDGRSPRNVRRDELPAVTEAQVAEFLSLAGGLIGAKTPRQNSQNPLAVSPRDAGTLLSVLAVLSRLTETPWLLMSCPRCR
jgi:hypothetical protein